MIVLKNVLALLESEGINRDMVHRVYHHLCDRVLDADDIIDILSSEARPDGAVLANRRQLRAGIDRAEKIIEQCNRLDIVMLTAASDLFPDSLRSIPDPPVLLYVRGDVSCLLQHSIAIVGTRQPSERGFEMARNFGMQAAGLGFAVTSGLAVGIDTAAHEGCLHQCGKTIAVLANGVDEVAVPQSRGLAEQIVEQCGCLVSEYPPGAKPRRRAFVERDRLQSGLSLAVLVVETDMKGGAMHTVRFGVAQGKRIACLHPAGEHASHAMTNGNRYLIEHSIAMPISNDFDLQRLAESLPL